MSLPEFYSQAPENVVAISDAVVRDWNTTANRILSLTPPLSTAMISEVQEMINGVPHMLDQLARAQSELGVTKVQREELRDARQRFGDQVEGRLKRLQKLIDDSATATTSADKEAHSDPKVALLNNLLKSAGVAEIEESFADQASFDMERKRLSKEIELFVAKQLVNQLKNVSNQYVVTGDPHFWSAITMSTGLPDTPEYTLQQWINSLPANGDFKINGVSTKETLLDETVKYLLNLIKWLSSESGRAALLQVYGKPEDFVTEITSDKFSKIPFDREMLVNMLTYDVDPSASEEREKEQSVFAAFRDVMSVILIITDVPTDPARKSIYTSYAQQYNMWPLGVKQGDSGVATQQATFDWVKSSLSGKYPDEVLELGFRLAVAHCRHTGLEEYFDLRPLEIGEPKLSGKTRAVRSMSRLYHMEEWAKNSVEESGTAREPVAIKYATRHPAVALPADKLWFVNVKMGGTVKSMSVFEVLRSGRWDAVITEDNPSSTTERVDFPDDPTATFANHTKFGLLHYQALFMGETALKVLPDISEITKIEHNGMVEKDVNLATKMFKFANSGQRLSLEDRDYLLAKLYKYEEIAFADSTHHLTADQERRALDSLLFVFSEKPQKSPVSGIVKDACDYYWDNTPIKEAIFRELFQREDGTENSAVMNAVRNNDKSKFVMTAFWMLVRAELERRSIPEEEVAIRARQWHNNAVDYLVPVRTASNQRPYTWAQRVALKDYLMEVQRGFKPDLARFARGKEAIDEIFESVGVEGNEAIKIADLQWILVQDPEVLKKHIKGKPAIMDNLLGRSIAKAQNFTKEQGTT